MLLFLFVVGGGGGCLLYKQVSDVPYHPLLIAVAVCIHALAPSPGMYGIVCYPLHRAEWKPAHNNIR